MKLKNKILKAALLGCVLGGVYTNSVETNAESYIFSGENVRFDYPNNRPNLNGDFYWHSSRAREWLHSTDETVQYTNTGVVQRDYIQGFLTDFTQDEIKQIATTRRKAFVHGGYHGVSQGMESGLHSGNINHAGGDGMGRLLPYFMDYYNNPLYRYDNIRHIPTHDKVFLLNPAEFQQYIGNRGLNVMRGGNSWWLSGTQTYTTNVSRGQIIRHDGRIGHAGGASTSVRGMVPALHLHPDSPTAQGLEIGDTVEFGRYTSRSNDTNFSGEIIWEVINITDEGYPLLFATERVENMPYNVHPDSNPKNSAHIYSDYINNEEYHVDLTDDLQFNNPDGDHTDIPIILLENTEDHETRRIDEWTAIMQAYSDIDIEWIEVYPDGNRVYGDTIEYLVTENESGRNNAFRAKDSQGNYGGAHLPVGNIDSEVEVDILFDLPDSGWVNDDLDVTIQLSNQEVHADGLNSGLVASGWSPFSPPTFTTYTGLRYRMEGQVRMVTPNVAEDYRGSGYDSNTFTRNTVRPGFLDGRLSISNNYDRERVFSYGELLDAGVGEWVDIEYTRQIQGTFLEFNGGLGFHRSPNFGTLGLDAPIIEFRDVSFTLLDTDDFEIERITLPNGEQITENIPSVFTDTLTESGNYRYEVLDSRGYTWIEDIDVNIDRNSPQLNTEIMN